MTGSAKQENLHHLCFHRNPTSQKLQTGFSDCSDYINMTQRETPRNVTTVRTLQCG